MSLASMDSLTAAIGPRRDAIDGDLGGIARSRGAYFYCRHLEGLQSRCQLRHLVWVLAGHIEVFTRVFCEVEKTEALRALRARNDRRLRAVAVNTVGGSGGVLARRGRPAVFLRRVYTAHLKQLPIANYQAIT